MFCEQRQHVIEKRNTRPDLRLALAVDHQLQADARFLRLAPDVRFTRLHDWVLNEVDLKTKLN